MIPRLLSTVAAWSMVILATTAVVLAAENTTPWQRQGEPTPAKPESRSDWEESCRPRVTNASLELWQVEPTPAGMEPVGCAAGDCGCTCDGGCRACNQWCAPTWYVGADLLIWWTKGTRVPPLVTTSPDGTDINDGPGVIGADGTQILHGDGLVDGNYRPGVRVVLGWWLDPCQCTALEATWFTLGDGANSGNFFAESVGTPLSPILARPYIDAFTNQNAAELVAFPDLLEGSVQVQTSSELHSASVLLRRNWYQNSQTRVDLVGGYRFLRYREGLAITEHLTSTATSGLVAQGTTLDLVDSFDTRSEFNGAELGISTAVQRGFWTVDVLAKLAFGNMHQHVNIDGSTVVTVPTTDPDLRRGGLLALATNIGEESRDKFALIPELNLNLKYDVTDSLALTAGYSLLWVTDVARSGDQIDPRVNQSYLPAPGVTRTGPRLPARLMGDSSMWAQGLNLGFVWEY